MKKIIFKRLFLLSILALSTAANAQLVSPDSTTIVVDNTAPQEENKNLLRKLNTQFGVALNSSFVDELKGSRRFETIKSDSIQFKLRMEKYINEQKTFSYVPKLSLGKAFQTLNLPIELELKNYFLYINSNPYRITPMGGITFSKNSHLYLKNNYSIGISNDIYTTLSLGAIYSPILFNKTWRIAFTFDYTPFYRMDRAEISDTNLTGPGWYLGLGTLIFNKLNLEISTTFFKLKNNELTINRSEVLTNILYKY